MPQLKIGTITITIPDDLPLREEAGKLGADAIQALRKARPGVGLVCEETADAIEKEGEGLVLPPQLTPEALRTAGHRAEGMDLVLRDLELARLVLTQLNLLYDADADGLLGLTNDYIKVQSKQNPSLETRFGSVRNYFKRGRG